MVKLRFIVRRGRICLCVAEGVNRYYKTVHFIGEPNLKHWSSKHERFSEKEERYEENNRILDDFRELYYKVIREHPELPARVVANFYDKKSSTHTGSQPIKINTYKVEEYRDSVSKYLEVLVGRLRYKNGCTFENYYKLLKKCKKCIPYFDYLRFSDIDYNKMVEIAYCLAEEKSYLQHTKIFRAMLGKASVDRNVLFQLQQIGDFRFCDYNPKRNEANEHIPDVLTSEQLKKFFALDPINDLPKYKNSKMSGIYHDFCCFMFHSFFAPCDVIKAKLKDITKRGTLVMMRKKTHRRVEVPITPIMQEIIDKYKGQSKDGYIFPILDDEKEKTHKTKDYTYKVFREKLNSWLKHIGKLLGLDYEMYAYVFRHTAITVAIDSGLPLAYVANAAGTSIEMIQRHYYNGEHEKNRNMLTTAFMTAIAC